MTAELRMLRPGRYKVSLGRETEKRHEPVGEVTLERGRSGVVRFVLPAQTTCTLRLEEIAAR